jgi:hypothetical protein
MCASLSRFATAEAAHEIRSAGYECARELRVRQAFAPHPAESFESA